MIGELRYSEDTNADFSDEFAARWAFCWIHWINSSKVLTPRGSFGTPAYVGQQVSNGLAIHPNAVVANPNLIEERIVAINRYGFRIGVVRIRDELSKRRPRLPIDAVRDPRYDAVIALKLPLSRIACFDALENLLL